MRCATPQHFIFRRLGASTLRPYRRLLCAQPGMRATPVAPPANARARMLLLLLTSCCVCPRRWRNQRCRALRLSRRRPGPSHDNDGARITHAGRGEGSGPHTHRTCCRPAHTRRPTIMPPTMAAKTPGWGTGMHLRQSESPPSAVARQEEAPAHQPHSQKARAREHVRSTSRGTGRDPRRRRMRNRMVHTNRPKASDRLIHEARTTCLMGHESLMRAAYPNMQRTRTSAARDRTQARRAAQRVTCDKDTKRAVPSSANQRDGSRASASFPCGPAAPVTHAKESPMTASMRSTREAAI